MRRILTICVVLVVATGAAHASAGFSCDTEEKVQPAFSVGGAMPRSGGNLINFGAALEIEPGKKIEFTKANIHAIKVDNKTVNILLKRKTADGIVEVSVATKSNDEDEYFGNYTVRLGKSVRTGKIKCTTD